MKRSLLIVLPLLLLLGALAAGCAPTTTVEAALQATYTPAPDSAEMAATVEPAAASDTAASEETTELAMLPEETRPDSECIACHSDAEQLQLLAEEEEVQESLNEGSG